MSLFFDWCRIELQTLTTRSHDPLFVDELLFRMYVDVGVTRTGFLLVN